METERCLWGLWAWSQIFQRGEDQGYGSDMYDSQPGGYGYGRTKDYGGSQGGFDHYLVGNYRDNYN